MNQVAKRFLRRQCLLSRLGDVKLVAKYPFSVSLMDAGHDFCELTVTEIKKFCKEKWHKDVEQVLVLSTLFSKEREYPETTSVHFQSETTISLVELPEGEQIAICVFGTEIISK